MAAALSVFHNEVSMVAGSAYALQAVRLSVEAWETWFLPTSGLEDSVEAHIQGVVLGSRSGASDVRNCIALVVRSPYTHFEVSTVVGVRLQTAGHDLISTQENQMDTHKRPLAMSPTPSMRPRAREHWNSALRTFL